MGGLFPRARFLYAFTTRFELGEWGSEGWDVTGAKAPARLKARPVKGLLLRCTVPTVVTVATSSLCGVMSDVFVNRNMNPLTVSKLTVAFPLVGLTTTFNSLININTSALISMGLKRGSCTATRGVLNGMIALGFVVNVKFDVLALLFLSPVLCFFKTDPSAVSCTQSCVIVVLLNGIVARVCLKLGTLLHTSKRPRGTVATAVAAMVVGAVLSPVFVCLFR